MQTQKIDEYYLDEEDEDRGPVVAHLTLHSTNTVHNLYRGSNQIGRGTQNDVVVEDVTVSDVHAEIEIRENNEAHVKDLRSSNGTIVETEASSNDYTHVLKGQTLLLKEGCYVRFGLIQLKYSLAGIAEGDNEANENDDEGGQFDVESDDEKEGKVELNLDLRGVVDSVGPGGKEPVVSASYVKFDEPTQEQVQEEEDKAVLSKRSNLQASKFDQETQKFDVDFEDNDNENTDTTFQQDGDSGNEPSRNALYDSATEVYADEIELSNLEAKKEHGVSEEEPTFIVDQSLPELNRRTSSGSVESPTQIVPDYPPSAVQGSDTEVETEGEEEEEANVTLTSEDDTRNGTLVDSSMVPSTSKPTVAPSAVWASSSNQTADDDSDAESEDIMMNSQAELSQDALQLILPPELQEMLPEDVVKDPEGLQEKLVNVNAETTRQEGLNAKSTDVTAHGSVDGENAALEPYLTQVSPSKRVDIRAVEEECKGEGSPALNRRSSRRRRGRPPLAEQLEAVDDNIDTSADVNRHNKNVDADKERRNDDEEEIVLTDNCDAEELPQNTFPVSLSNLLPKFVQNLLSTPPSSASASAKKKNRNSSSSSSSAQDRFSVSGVASPPLDGQFSSPVIEMNESGRPSRGANGSDGIEVEEVVVEQVVLVEDTEKQHATKRPTRGRNKTILSKCAEQMPLSDDVPQTSKKSAKRDREMLEQKQEENKDEDEDEKLEEVEVAQSPHVPEKQRVSKGKASKASPKASPVPASRSRRRPSEKSVVPEPIVDPETELKLNESMNNKKRKVVGKENGDSKKEDGDFGGESCGGGNAKKRSKISLKTATSRSSISRNVEKPMEIDDDEEDENAPLPLPLRVLFTGVEADTRLKRLVAKIGGTIVDIADMAGVTHVVTISSLKRTPKMLVALNLGACYIVGVNWLEDSANQSAPIAIDLASHSKSAASSPKKKSRGGSSGRGNHNEVDYLIHDHDRKWDPFNIVDTLNRNYKRVHAVDGGGTRLFDGLGIFIASDVFGNRAPSKDEMRMVVESGGGIFLTTAAEIAKFDKGRPTKGGIVIVPKDAKKAPAKSVVAFAKSFADSNKVLYSVEFLFSAVMRQELDYEIGIITDITV